MAENWSIKGGFFETCNCEVACPCAFLSPPTDGECKAVVAWHIDSGNYGDVNLDDINVALAVHSPGHMAEGKWNVALYLDEKASEAQGNALGQIFGGQAGGHFEVLGGFIGNIIGVKNVAIEYEANGKERSIRIPNVVEAEIEGIEGQGGEAVTLAKQPLAVVPGGPTIVAKSKQFSYHDHGMDWEFSNKSGLYSEFSYAGP